MKNLLSRTALTAVLMVASILSFAQQRIYLGAGSTINGPRHEDINLTQCIGYFVGVTGEALLEGPFRYSASLQVVKQHMEIIDVDLSVNAINASFYYGIEAIGDLTVLAGLQTGYVVDVELDDVDVPDYGKEQFGWVAGLSYDVMDQLKIEGRYVQAINEQIFSNTIQFGAHYSFGK